MRILRTGIALLAVLLGGPILAAGRTHERVRISPCRPEFLLPSGEPFHPWGFNYDRDYRGRLLEEYWLTDWSTIAADFAEMKRLGANTVRVHLQVADFLYGPTQANPAALQQLGRLLRLAERSGLRVNLTGLGCYRRTGVPSWYDRLDEPTRWQAQATFWRAVAGVAARSPALFCYNLMNEPFVPVQPRSAGDWLAGEFGGFSYVQAIALDPAGRPRAAIAREWVRQLRAAIRSQDPAALITVGLLPETRSTGSFSGFDPEVMAGELDFLSVHLYPREDRLEVARDVLRACRSPKPLVVEETFPLHISSAGLCDFIREQSGEVAGWLTFYWGQAPEDLAPQATLDAAILHDWLVRWQILSRNLRMRHWSQRGATIP